MKSFYLNILVLSCPHCIFLKFFIMSNKRENDQITLRKRTLLSSGQEALHLVCSGSSREICVAGVSFFWSSMVYFNATVMNHLSGGANKCVDRGFPVLAGFLYLLYFLIVCLVYSQIMRIAVAVWQLLSIFFIYRGVTEFALAAAAKGDNQRKTMIMEACIKIATGVIVEMIKRNVTGVLAR